MAVHPPKGGGPGTGGAVQVTGGGKGLAGPQVLVPAPAFEPALAPGGPGPHPAQCVLDGGRARKVHLALLAAQAQHVGMAFDEAREQRAARELDLGRLGKRRWSSPASP